MLYKIRHSLEVLPTGLVLWVLAEDCETQTHHDNSIPLNLKDQPAEWKKGDYIASAGEGRGLKIQRKNLKLYSCQF